VIGFQQLVSTTKICEIFYGNRNAVITKRQLIAVHANKGMQTDLRKRYALAPAADAGR